MAAGMDTFPESFVPVKLSELNRCQSRIPGGSEWDDVHRNLGTLLIF